MWLVVLLVLVLFCKYVVLDNHCVWVSLFSSWNAHGFFRYNGPLVSPGEKCERVTIDSISGEKFYREYQSVSRPLIIHVPGGFKTMDWKTDSWNSAYFVENFWDDQINLEIRFPNGNFETKVVTFTEFLFILEQSNSDYHINYPSLSRAMLPPLSRVSQDFTIPSFILSEPLIGISLSIGNSKDPEGAQSPLRHDTHNHLVAQVKGTKVFKLFSPADAMNLYPTGIISEIGETGMTIYCSKTDHAWSHLPFTDTASEADYPRVKQATPMGCALEEGDFLFIPNGWWYETTTHGNYNTAIHFWTEGAE
eukprot:TRINITY_DN22154_c0_g1_i1.p1 TRINITY_DN22154_c0_g1~~TRINITY_DN22154_c0_g1_i1.p1  ORF type:complete len:338 (-),score=68.73 TRINITY_DN22154_c0_g1_i1:87-1007(-)